jgi:long-subunit acyl-CoA synthetase (AMP-forming)
MSECTGPATISLPEPFKYRTGWAGPELPGAANKIADDGEVLMKGRHVFKGYFKNDAATAETIDKDGWLHSGDIGEIDDKGFLKITDRKKELIITSGGENIPPQVLEAKLRSISAVAIAIVIGDRRKFITALFTLDPERLDQELKNAGSPAKNMAEAAKCLIFKAYIQHKIDEINATLARVQTIKKFTILPNEFSVDGGELTPTMKLKRRIINTKYAKEIEDMYK